MAKVVEGLVKELREEVLSLHEPMSYIGDVVKKMGKGKILVKVHYLIR